MKMTITYLKRYLTKNLFLSLLALALVACQSESTHTDKRTSPGQVVKNFKDYPTMKLALVNGETMTLHIAKSNSEQTQGLSGVKDNELSDNLGMIFTYEKMGPRGFWMPNTYVNLDIIFLDNNYRIVHIERDVPAHPGMKEPPKIARTPVIRAQYVVELKATSELSQKLKKGMLLTKVSD